MGIKKSTGILVAAKFPLEQDYLEGVIFNAELVCSIGLDRLSTYLANHFLINISLKTISS